MLLMPEKINLIFPSRQHLIGVKEASFEQNLCARIPALQSCFLDPTPQTGILSVQLKLVRFNRIERSGRTSYVLRAHVELNDEAHFLVRKYHLDRTVVYDNMRHRHVSHDCTAQNLIGRNTSTNEDSSLPSFYFTIDSLISGVQIECKNLHQLLDIEQAITQACENTKIMVQDAQTFEGRADSLGF
jgi:hypothetical protein